MTVTFYKVTDDPRTVSKTLGTAIVTLNNVKTKDNCSITAPELELAYTANLTKCNYIYIQDWGRYYFVDKMTVSQQRIIIAAHIDVLMTYATEIKKCTGIIKRQEKTGAGSKTNLYLNDKAFISKAYNNPTVKLFKQKNGEISTFTKDKMSFIIALAGAGNSP